MSAPIRSSFTYRCPTCGDVRSWVPGAPDEAVECGRQRKDEPKCCAVMVRLAAPP